MASDPSSTSSSVPAITVRSASQTHTHTISQQTYPSFDKTGPSSILSSSASSIQEDPNASIPPDTPTAITRPKLGTRKSSGTLIVDREHPRVELQVGEEVFDEDDARAMSPRRNSEDLEKMSQDARAQLNEHAKILQQSLLEIFNRIEAVKEEHDKLDNNNKFLQKYIGDLMSTSKITSTGAGGRKK